MHNTHGKHARVTALIRLDGNLRRTSCFSYRSFYVLAVICAQHTWQTRPRSRKIRPDGDLRETAPYFSYRFLFTPSVNLSPVVVVVILVPFPCTLCPVFPTVGLAPFISLLPPFSRLVLRPYRLLDFFDLRFGPKGADGSKGRAFFFRIGAVCLGSSAQNARMRCARDNQPKFGLFSKYIGKYDTHIRNAATDITNEP